MRSSSQALAPTFAIRFFAAMVVVLHHTHDYAPLGFLDIFAERHHLMIEFFFILSGYIIAHVYLASFETGLSATRTFFLSRLARMYPAHIAMLAIFVVYLAIGTSAGLQFNRDRFTPEGFVSQLLLLDAWGFVDHLSWNYPTWSLSAELAANIAFPLIALGVNRITKDTAALVLIVAVSGFALLGDYFHVTERTVDFAIVRTLPEFVIGVLAFKARDRFKIPGVSWNALFLVSLIATIAMQAAGAPRAFAVVTLTPLIVASAHLTGSLARALSNKVLVKLGVWSFSLYLVHAFVLSVVFNIWRLPAISALGLNTYTPVVIAISLSIGAAYLMNRYVEVPIRNAARGPKPAKYEAARDMHGTTAAGMAIAG